MSEVGTFKASPFYGTGTILFSIFRSLGTILLMAAYMFDLLSDPLMWWVEALFVIFVVGVVCLFIGRLKGERKTEMILGTKV